jgi:Xaa-Pro aminopeptidase
MDTRSSPIPVRLESVRDALRAQGLAGVLVPSSDPHLSEYLPERWQGRVWLSGFTGSMATLVVTTERAALFADSRYWTQAEHELRGSGIDLVKIPTGAAAHHHEWIVANVTPGGTVAVDGQVLGLAAAQQLKSALDAACIGLRTSGDVLAAAWDDRPGLPQARVYAHQAPHAATPTSWPRCAPAWPATARRITSSRRWTTSPGSRTCAVPTSTTTRCSSRTC